jgi:uncharacterized protein (DUF1501 family)
MNRRKFIGTSIKACAATAFSGGFIEKAFSQSMFLHAIAGSCTDNILVLIQLNGGNDGLNTIIPIDQYSIMSTVRSNILIPESKVLKTTKYNQTGFHPSISGMYNLFEASKMNVIQGCSYNNPDLSHFRATDIWMSGSDSNEFLKTGWIGRNLDEQYPGWPMDYPNQDHPDPLAIQMGSSAALGLEGAQASFGIATTNISTDYSLLSGFGDAVPNTYAGCYLDFIRRVAVNTDKYNARIVAAAKAQSSNMSTKYGSGGLSNQLKNVARLIKGGLRTRVYMVSLAGFDTHAAQTETAQETGSHADLLKQVSEAIAGFQDDIELMGVSKRVTGMVFSEFGRRVNSNGSKGTDHGTAIPLILFGSELKGQMYGANPDLKKANSNTAVDNVPMQYDYRSVYYSVLKDWFGLSNSQLSNVFGGKEYQYLDLFKPGSKCTGLVATESLLSEKGETDYLLDVYPTVIDDSAIIPFYSTGGEVRLNLYDISGQLVKELSNVSLEAGPQKYYFEKQGLKSGTYIVEMITKNSKSTKKMIIN